MTSVKADIGLLPVKTDMSPSVQSQTVISGMVLDYDVLKGKGTIRCNETHTIVAVSYCDIHSETKTLRRLVPFTIVEFILRTNGTAAVVTFPKKEPIPPVSVQEMCELIRKNKEHWTAFYRQHVNVALLKQCADIMKVNLYDVVPELDSRSGSRSSRSRNRSRSRSRNGRQSKDRSSKRSRSRSRSRDHSNHKRTRSRDHNRSQSRSRSRSRSLREKKKTIHTTTTIMSNTAMMTDLQREFLKLHAERDTLQTSLKSTQASLAEAEKQLKAAYVLQTETKLARDRLQHEKVDTIQTQKRTLQEMMSKHLNELKMKDNELKMKDNELKTKDKFYNESIMHVQTRLSSSQAEVESLKRRINYQQNILDIQTTTMTQQQYYQQTQQHIWPQQIATSQGVLTLVPVTNTNTHQSAALPQPPPPPRNGTATVTVVS